MNYIAVAIHAVRRLETVLSGPLNRRGRIVVKIAIPRSRKERQLAGEHSGPRVSIFLFALPLWLMSVTRSPLSVAKIKPVMYTYHY